MKKRSNLTNIVRKKLQEELGEDLVEVDESAPGIVIEEARESTENLNDKPEEGFTPLKMAISANSLTQMFVPSSESDKYKDQKVRLFNTRNSKASLETDLIFLARRRSMEQDDPPERMHVIADPEEESDDGKDLFNVNMSVSNHPDKETDDFPKRTKEATLKGSALNLANIKKARSRRYERYNFRTTWGALNAEREEDNQESPRSMFLTRENTMEYGKSSANSSKDNSFVDKRKSINDNARISDASSGRNPLDNANGVLGSRRRAADPSGSRSSMSKRRSTVDTQSFNPNSPNRRRTTLDPNRLPGRRNTFDPNSLFNSSMYEDEEIIEETEEPTESEPESEIEQKPAPAQSVSTKKTPKTVLIDSQVLKKSYSSDFTSDEERLETKSKHSDFSKAPTGRLNSSKINSPTKHEKQDLLSVMLVGQKVNYEPQKFVESKPITIENPITIPKREETPEELEPVYIKNESVEPEAETEVTEEKPMSEESVDIGSFQNIDDVDSIVTHFASILENRKKTLYTERTTSDYDLSKFKNVPVFTKKDETKGEIQGDEMPTGDKPSTPHAELNIQDDLLVSIAIRPSIEVPDVDSGINIKENGQNIAKTERLSTSARISFKSNLESGVIKRDVKSASNIGTTVDNTPSNSVTWSCSCPISDSNCSRCLSAAQSHSRPKTGESTSETTTTRESTGKDIPKMVQKSIQKKTAVNKPPKLPKPKFTRRKHGKEIPQKTLIFAKYATQEDITNSLKPDPPTKRSRYQQRLDELAEKNNLKHMLMLFEKQNELTKDASEIAKEVQEEMGEGQTDTDNSPPKTPNAIPKDDEEEAELLEVKGAAVDNTIILGGAGTAVIGSLQPEHKPEVEQSKLALKVAKNIGLADTGKVLTKVTLNDTIDFVKDKLPGFVKKALPDFIINTATKGRLKKGKLAVQHPDFFLSLNKDEIEQTPYTVHTSSTSLGQISSLNYSNSNDPLDGYVIKALQEYEKRKVVPRESKDRRKSTATFQLPKENVETEDEYITEEEPDEEKKPNLKAQQLWRYLKKDIMKKTLINALKPEKLMIEPESEVMDVAPPAAADELIEKLEPKNEVIAKPQSSNEISPKTYYTNQRRAIDMIKNPHLYTRKTVDPLTNKLDLNLTLRPVIGLPAERDKPSATDSVEAIHTGTIRSGLAINGYTKQNSTTLYEVVHNIKRRKLGLTPLERIKYPTFDDPGPPLDATGTPILKEDGAASPVQEINFEEELEKINQLIEASKVPIPAHHRRRGVIFSRMEKFIRAMEDLDLAIQFDPFNSDGLWHRHQLYLRYNDAESALRDLDAITENNKIHLAAFQAKARIYQAIGMFKLAIINYSTVIRLKSDCADAYYNRACLFEIDHETTFANEDFRIVRMLDPNNDQAIQNLAMYSFQRQLWSDAINEFTKLILIDPEDADAYMFRGRSYAALSFYYDAMEDLTQAIRISPDNFRYFFHRGCLLREQNPQWAIQDLSVSILLNPYETNSDAFYHRALLYQRLGFDNLAIADYMSGKLGLTQAIELDPRKAKAFLNLGALYMKNSSTYAEAKHNLNLAISADPCNLRGYINRGELYEKIYKESLLTLTTHNSKRAIRGNKLEMVQSYAYLAIKDYSRAIHIRPSNYVLFLYRGRMLLSQGKVPEATKDFHAAFDLNSGIAQTFIQRALILSFQRKYKQVIDEFDERKKRFKHIDDPVLLSIVAKARIQYGDYQGALNDLVSVSDAGKDDPQISLQKGICYEHLKNWSLAEEEFSKCIGLIPKFSKAYFHRGICRFAQGNEDGEQDLNYALELDPKFFDAYLTRAAYYESKGQYQKAIADCDEALKIEPTSIRAHILRGNSKCRLNQFGIAIMDYTKAATIDKVHIVNIQTSYFAFFNRAMAFEASGDHHNAIKDYSIVLLLNDNNLNAYRQRAILYWKLGDNQNALCDFIEAVKISPKEAKLRSLLGLAYQKVGKLQESCVEFTESMKLEPSTKEAILGRGNVYANMKELELSRRDYCRVLHMYPTNAETYVNIAYTKQSEGEYKLAWKFFTMAFTIDPLCTSALEGRSLINSLLNNQFAAYLDITRAIEISPHNAEFLTNRGVIYEAMNDNVSALQNYKIAIKANPNYALAYYNAGNHYLKQRNWEKAIEYLSTVIYYNSRQSN
ncbi:cytochrome c oxidase subunit 1 [Boothiomyces macroporosus]|uniref:Cytochrome c oxidase subunit 1 n=1 Tax=Boothiomyces macroporosus TaxID=261099 RepID=A0AAD5UJA6_9FUNG|nr:cytochrome c oxidase subunit 1 [Boothiomyces macroporosus]